MTLVDKTLFPVGLACTLKAIEIITIRLPLLLNPVHVDNNPNHWNIATLSRFDSFY